ncbi:MAG: DUF2849 domain-containing protein [Alphaproteobacteria bacterium]|nr:DUF2849 domain-containing protein [Alphaproteobacteria bacterium]
MALQVLTANRLRDGAVVYLSPDGSWVERVAAARAESAPEAVARLEAAGRAAVVAREVVEPYPIAVEQGEDGRLIPVRYRERIRAEGPSIRLQCDEEAA